MKKLVSVIIPTFQGADYIMRAVNSVLNQVYNHLEIIVIDDNGKGSKTQISTYNALLPVLDKINYIVLERHGNGSTARNAGAVISRGEYLCFLDDDDSISEDKIHFQVEQLEKLDATWGASYSSCSVIKDGKEVNYIRSLEEGAILKDYLNKKIWIGMGSVLIRKEAYQMLNGFNESYERHQDWEFFSRLLDNYKIAASPDVKFVRFHTNRNYTIDLPKAEQQLNYYVDGLKKNIQSLTRKELEKITYKIYIDFASRYIRRGDIISFLRMFFFRCGGVKSIPMILVGYYTILKKCLSGKRFS